MAVAAKRPRPRPQPKRPRASASELNAVKVAASVRAASSPAVVLVSLVVMVVSSGSWARRGGAVDAYWSRYRGNRFKGFELQNSTSYINALDWNSGNGRWPRCRVWG